MKNLVTVMQIIFVAVICAQCAVRLSDEEKLAKAFVDSMLNDSVTSESIADQFIQYKHDQKGKAFIVEYLETVRTHLKQKERSLKNFRIANFSEAKPQLKDIMITEEEEDDVYAVLSERGELVFPLLIENNKIVSFTTLNKGQRKFFMGYGE